MKKSLFLILFLIGQSWVFSSNMVEPVKEFDLTGNDFATVLATAKKYSDEKNALFAVIRSDDKDFTQLVVRTMNGQKQLGLENLYIIFADKTYSENPYEVTFVIDGKYGGDWVQKSGITYSSQTYVNTSELIDYINKLYHEHITSGTSIGITN